EGGAAAEDEPDLVALPDRPDRVDENAPLPVVAADEVKQHGDAQIEAVEDGETDEEHAQKAPPDDAQRFVIERHDRSSRSSLAGTRVGMQFPVELDAPGRRLPRSDVRHQPLLG